MAMQSLGKIIRTTNGTNGHLLQDDYDVQAKKTKLSIPDSPRETLQKKAAQLNINVMSEAFAQCMDHHDPLRHFRDEFCYPKMKDLPDVNMSLEEVDPEDDCIYFCGNSLGLMPKMTQKYLERELNKWAKWGVYGHMKGELPWVSSDECCTEQMARIVGALPGEVALMNGLTVNLHLLLASFYKPEPDRNKILIEAKAFPSDHYAVESQIEMHGYDPKSSLLLIHPRQDEETINQDDLISLLKREGRSIAVLLLSGIQYYTGQLFDIETITKVAQEQGIYVGWDMAHAVGNVELKLHDWNVDFAVWCTYKYLSAGAGSIGGAFMHEKNNKTHGPGLRGWWSHKLGSRFKMDNRMDLQVGIQGYRLTNPSILSTAALKASLDTIGKTTMKEMRAKSLLLTAYLELLILHYFSKGCHPSGAYITIFTPSNPNERGCQLSLCFSKPIHTIFDELTQRGIVCDKRLPNVIRIAPHHLYNSFHDVYRFIQILHKCME